MGRPATLAILRFSAHGAILDAREMGELLLPARYVTEAMKAGDSVDVFIFRDSDDRPVATTDMPLATVGQVACLQVTDVNRAGAFLDWGLPKDLLVPFSEQKTTMEKGRRYPVYIYVDNNTGRIAATARLNKYIGNVIPRYRRGDKVSAIITGRADIGWRAVVDNLHFAMLYDDETYLTPATGTTVDAYVRRVRPDGKIDLRLNPDGFDRIDPIGRRITDAITAAGGSIDIGDKSSPQLIADTLRCSKKDFKRAVGTLYRQGIVVPAPASTSFTPAARKRFLSR